MMRNIDMKFFKHLIFRNQTSMQDAEEKLMIEEYKRKGKEILDTAWNILNSTDGWKLEKQTADGTAVYSKHLPGFGKFFKLSGEVRFPPQRLLIELYNKIEQTPKWNPTLVESRQVQAVDENTDVNYLVTAEAAGGLVCRRDYVNLRSKGIRDGCYVSAGAAINHPNVPPHNKYIRGENGPNCWVMRPMPDAPDRCKFEWLLNTKLNGWIPQYIVESALTGGMLDFIKHINAYGQKLRDEGQLGA